MDASPLVSSMHRPSPPWWTVAAVSHSVQAAKHELCSLQHSKPHPGCGLFHHCHILCLTTYMLGRTRFWIREMKYWCRKLTLDRAVACAKATWVLDWQWLRGVWLRWVWSCWATRRAIKFTAFAVTSTSRANGWPALSEITELARDRGGGACKFGITFWLDPSGRAEPEVKEWITNCGGSVGPFEIFWSARGGLGCGREKSPAKK